MTPTRDIDSQTETDIRTDNGTRTPVGTRIDLGAATTMARAAPTTGTMISTLCFAGVALVLADAALQAGGLRAAGLWVCSLAAAAGALRHPIARGVARLRRSA